MGLSSENDTVIQLRAPLKPIYTTAKTTLTADEETPTTPTSEGSRIPAKLPCPLPPRKRKPSFIGGAGGGGSNMRCKSNNKMCNGKREFFITPAHLEAVFIRRHNVGC